MVAGEKYFVYLVCSLQSSININNLDIFRVGESELFEIVY